MYSAMIKGSRDVEEGLRFLRELKLKTNLTPKLRSYTPLLSKLADNQEKLMTPACRNEEEKEEKENGMVEIGMGLLEEMVEGGIELNEVSYLHLLTSLLPSPPSFIQVLHHFMEEILLPTLPALLDVIKRFFEERVDEEWEVTICEIDESNGRILDDSNHQLQVWEI